MTDDVLIRNAKIVDGLGRPAFSGNVLISGGKIAAIEREGSVLFSNDAGKVIDVQGAVLAPGFVDPHSHSDATFFLSPRPENKIRQGVTSDINGNCGMSAFPVQNDNLQYLDAYASESERVLGYFASFSEYRSRLQSFGLLGNQGFLVGHKALRTAVLGMEDRAPTRKELAQMKTLLAETLSQGCLGFSSGLLYPPMCFADTDELIALNQVVAEHGKIFACHMRNYSSELFTSVREMIRIARATGVKTHISHMMLAGRGNWGRAQEFLQVIEEARGEGLDIAFDAYPYCAANPGLGALFPGWMHAGGLDATLKRLSDPTHRERARLEMGKPVPGWENIAWEAGWENIILYSEVLDEINGLSILAVAQERGTDPISLVFDLFQSDPSCRMIVHWVREVDMHSIMGHEAHMFSSDSLDLGPTAHPRTYGSFPKVLGEFVRERQLLSLEDAIRKMTSQPADRFGLERRGRIQEGYWADLVVFDPQTVGSKSTYEAPNMYPVGISHVLVNGLVLYDAERLNPVKPGVVL